MNRPSLTSRLMGDPDPDRIARSKEIRARFPIRPGAPPTHARKKGPQT